MRPAKMAHLIYLPRHFIIKLFHIKYIVFDGWMCYTYRRIMECGDGMCYTVRVGEVVRGGE